MHIRPQIALLLIAGCAISTQATAQKVYKCGNSYSHIPCQGADTLVPADTRTADQRADALRAQKMQSREADSLEKIRLKDEANTRTADAANRKMAEKQAKAAQKDETDRAKPHKKSKEPEFFTARKAADAKN
jgi:hypothetical protein